ncbi:hypothetical protein T484DRAFT_1974551 [Baffinella frigidus]|nr:hypothetical protein T484DRAFT_1974551 [Cryptophyta sp. CCMP2293]
MSGGWTPPKWTKSRMWLEPFHPNPRSPQAMPGDKDAILSIPSAMALCHRPRATEAPRH